MTATLPSCVELDSAGALLLHGSRSKSGTWIDACVSSRACAAARGFAGDEGGTTCEVASSSA